MNPHVEKKRKYLYNEGFRKRDTLCGTYEENCIPYICEGFMDYLSLKTRGHIKNVVAILGWHISDEQVNKLKQKGRYKWEIFSIYTGTQNIHCLMDLESL
jgi:DNA primase